MQSQNEIMIMIYDISGLIWTLQEYFIYLF